MQILGLDCQPWVTFLFSIIKVIRSLLGQLDQLGETVAGEI
jgi:hypothetical protein